MVLTNTGVGLNHELIVIKKKTCQNHISHSIFNHLLFNFKLLPETLKAHIQLPFNYCKAE